jgi:energy-coupling factor transporter transmembrane protein EcfT
MFWLIFVLLFLLFLFLLIIFTKLTVTLDLNHSGDNDHFKIKFRAWYGLLRYTIDIPLVKVDDDGPNLIVKQDQKLGSDKANNKVVDKEEKITPDDVLNSLSNVKEIAQHVVGLHKIFRRFLKKMKVKKFEWHSQLGIGDAAHTGLLAGAAWAIKGSVIGIISHYMKLLTTPEVTITPEFNRLCSRTILQCIFQFRIGQAMIAGIQFIKYWKGGRPKLKSKPFSFFTN